MNSRKTALIAISAALCMTVTVPGAWAGKAGQATPASAPRVQQKASAPAGHAFTAHPTPKTIQRPVRGTAAGMNLKQPNRNAHRWKPSDVGFQGRLAGDRVGQRPGGIPPVEDGPGLMPEQVRRLKDQLAMEKARFRDRELGLSTPLPEGIDPRRIPGHNGPDRSGEGLDTSYPPGDRAREEYIAGVKREWRESGVIPPEGMDERTAGLIEYEDGESAWIEGDTRMGPDDENVTWGTLEPADSNSGDRDEKGAKDSGAVGDEDVMNEDAAEVEKDPEPEGDDPDEIRSPVGRYRDALGNADAAFRIQGAGQGAGDGRGSGGPESDPAERRRRKKLNDMWGATHVVPYVVGPADPEGGGPDEAGSPVAAGVAAFDNGYANQPAPGGEDPDDPRAGQGSRPVRSRDAFAGQQGDATTGNMAGHNFSPAVGDPGDPPGPDGPEF